MHVFAFFPIFTKKIVGYIYLHDLAHLPGHQAEHCSQ